MPPMTAAGGPTARRRRKGDGAKLPDGRWMVRALVNGRPRAFTGKTQAEAKQKAQRAPGFAGSRRPLIRRPLARVRDLGIDAQRFEARMAALPTRSHLDQAGPAVAPTVAWSRSILSASSRSVPGEATRLAPR
jgi:hypothetical protein